MPENEKLVERLRAHVIQRGGPAKHGSGQPVMPNGAWQMMLEAAAALTAPPASPATELVGYITEKAFRGLIDWPDDPRTITIIRRPVGPTDMPRVPIYASPPAPAAVKDLVARLEGLANWLVSRGHDGGALDLREAATTLSTLAAEVQSMKSDREYVIGFNAGWDEALAQANPAFTSPAAVDVEGLVARLVKPLEWKFFPQGFPPCWCAQTPFGDCVVEEEAGSDGPSYAARGIRMNVVARTEGLPEAKAAAQADYTARILSAIDATALATLAAERDEANRWTAIYEAEQSAISAALPGVRFMDPPDGGDVKLSEQVRRMRDALDAAEARIKVLDHECQSSMATIAAERARADKAEAALLSARSAEPEADAYYEAWKENFERKVRFAYAHPTPEASDV